MLKKNSNAFVERITNMLIFPQNVNKKMGFRFLLNFQNFHSKGFFLSKTPDYTKPESWLSAFYLQTLIADNAKYSSYNSKKLEEFNYMNYWDIIPSNV